MELKSALEKLKKSSEFKEWFRKNNKTYFSYAFTMIENNEQQEWQIGYYDKNKDKVTTFVIGEGDIAINPEEDIFKKSDMEVKEIDINQVKLALPDMLDEIEKLLKKEYPKEIALKKIVILQNLEDFGDIWNVTYITQFFNTLNIKIKTADGKILEHKLTPLMEFTS